MIRIFNNLRLVECDTQADADGYNRQHGDIVVVRVAGEKVSLVDKIYDTIGSEKPVKINTILVESELKILKKDGAVTTEVMNITSAGTITSGKSKVQQTQTNTGLIMKDVNAIRWKIEVSGTGQLVATKLGL